MQFENTNDQCVMWRKLNEVMAKHGVPSPYFKGFMVNNAQVNWNVMHIVYESNDLYVQLQDKERTCSFHWSQLIDKHTKWQIKPKLRDQHKALCYEYTNSRSLEKANV
jgi:hypothetical protein